MSVIESPCRKVCRLDNAGAYCTACRRTLAQIRDWRIYTDNERQAIMERLAASSPELLASGDKRSGDSKEE